MSVYYTTAFLLGLAGSLHCVGMCSPLTMAVTRISRPALISKVLYNGGRIFTYTIMGALAGILGGLFDFLALQKVFSITVGTGLIIFGISGSRSFHIPLLSPLMVRINQLIKKSFSSLSKKGTRFTVLTLGLANGLLPCGLTYMALAYSMTATDSVQGAICMLLFGAGTLPAMLGLPLGLTALARRLSLNLPRINAAILILVGLLLVSRNFVHFPMMPDVSQVHSMPMPEPICR